MRARERRRRRSCRPTGSTSLRRPLPWSRERAARARARRLGGVGAPVPPFGQMRGRQVQASLCSAAAPVSALLTCWGGWVLVQALQELALLSLYLHVGLLTTSHVIHYLNDCILCAHAPRLLISRASYGSPVTSPRSFPRCPEHHSMPAGDRKTWANPLT